MHRVAPAAVSSSRGARKPCLSPKMNAMTHGRGQSTWIFIIAPGSGGGGCEERARARLDAHKMYGIVVTGRKMGERDSPIVDYASWPLNASHASKRKG